MENTVLNKNLSHNLYSEECIQYQIDNENTPKLHVDLMEAIGLDAEEYMQNKIDYKKLPKYLVLVENFINGEIKSEIIPALSITSAIDIAINQHKICEIYETRGASHEYHFYCQICGGQM